MLRNSLRAELDSRKTHLSGRSDTPCSAAERRRAPWRLPCSWSLCPSRLPSDHGVPALTRAVGVLNAETPWRTPGALDAAMERLPTV